MEYKEIIEFLAQLGPAGVVYLSIFIIGLVLKRWVMGWQYEEMKAQRDSYKQERDELLDIALFGVETSEKTTTALLRRPRKGA